MSILQTRIPPVKRPAKRRLRFFQIQFQIEGDAYAISLLPADPSIASKAFRFRKLTSPDGEEVTYDVRFTEHGPECECLGYRRHGHCKHGETLQAASQVFDLR